MTPTVGGYPPGTLVLVATPIGNLDDLSPRARAALAAAEVVCCEDTRRLATLLAHAGIPRPQVVVVNEHTEAGRIPEVLAHLDAGRRVVLTTDAGMPGVADPGERLVRAVLDAGGAVGVVPGPSAALAALVTSGLPAGRFCFEGFLPRKGSGRTERLAAVAAERRTTVLFEAPHRIVRTLADLAAACGDDRPVAVARELTKRYEQLWRGTLGEALAWAQAAEPAGELVLVLGGAPAPGPPGDADVAAAAARLVAEHRTTRDAADALAAELGIARRVAYDAVLRAATRGVGEGPAGAPD